MQSLTEYGASVCIRFRGITPAEFLIRWPERNWKHVPGLRMVDIRHPDRSFFKGFVIRDDGKFAPLGRTWKSKRASA